MYHFKRLFCVVLYILAIDLESNTLGPYSAGPYLGVFQIGIRAQGYREPASDEELEGPIKDQPLSADASPTALSPGYIADSNPEKDKEDPEEDPADHPADG
ncbi:hypothetical protein Tco_1002009 [Tanacetum coccineum]|uniref:Secreted protein n=1 Tax=Tanacetum coccineum TaxID=301880 RepID=A0ABQ5F534_9ASTR